MKTKSKKPSKKSKPQVPEFTRPTKEDLLERANAQAESAMYMQLCHFLNPTDSYYIGVSRDFYIAAEAYERWADEIAAEEAVEARERFLTEFEAEIEHDNRKASNALADKLIEDAHTISKAFGGYWVDLPSHEEREDLINYIKKSS